MNLNNNEISNFIPFVKCDVNLFNYNFLDFSYDKNILQRLNLNKLTKSIELKRHNVETTFRNEEAKRLLNIFGINIHDKTDNILSEEMQHLIFKQIINKIKTISEENHLLTYNKIDKILSFIYKIFNKKYIRKTKCKNVKELLNIILLETNKIIKKTRNDLEFFVICNNKTAALLRSHDCYVINNKIETNSMLFYDGEICKLKIFVDSHMSYDDNRIFIGKKTSLNQPGIVLFYKDPEILQYTDYLFNERKQMSMYFEVSDVGSTRSCFYHMVYL